MKKEINIDLHSCSEHSKSEIEFDFEEKDHILEKIEKMARNLDLNKNGILFLKDVEPVIADFPQHQRKPIADFLLSYYLKTRRITISLSTFIANLHRATTQGLFGLKEVFDFNSKCVSRNSPVKKMLHTDSFLKTPERFNLDRSFVQTKKTPHTEKKDISNTTTLVNECTFKPINFCEKSKYRNVPPRICARNNNTQMHSTCTNTTVYGEATTAKSLKFLLNHGYSYQYQEKRRRCSSVNNSAKKCTLSMKDSSLRNSPSEYKSSKSLYKEGSYINLCKTPC